MFQLDGSLSLAVKAIEMYIFFMSTHFWSEEDLDTLLEGIGSCCLIVGCIGKDANFITPAIIKQLTGFHILFF